MKNILAITYWSFKEPLVQSGALPYLRIISSSLPKNSKLFLFTLEKKAHKIHKDEKEKILKELSSHKITLISKRYYPFGIMSFLMWPLYLSQLVMICIQNRIQFIHAFGTPAGAIGYLISLITGKKLVVDCFEPHAETMLETGDWKKNNPAFKILFFFEKLQARKAYAIISHSSGMIDYIKEKYKTNLNKHFVRLNFVDFNLFNTYSVNRKQIRSALDLQENEIVCIYSGKIGGIYFENELFEFIKTASLFWKGAFTMIILTDTKRPIILEYLNKYGINKQRVLSSFVSHNEVKNYLSAADFAICPVKPILTKKYCSPIKNGEYWAMGLPVVIPSNIGDDSDIIEKEYIGAVMPFLNDTEYQIAIEKIDKLIHSDDIQVLKEKIISIGRKYRDIKNIEHIYQEIYS